MATYVEFMDGYARLMLQRNSLHHEREAVIAARKIAVKHGRDAEATAMLDLIHWLSNAEEEAGDEIQAMVRELEETEASS